MDLLGNDDLEVQNWDTDIQNRTFGIINTTKTRINTYFQMNQSFSRTSFLKAGVHLVLL